MKAKRTGLRRWTLYDYLANSFFLAILFVVIYPLYWFVIASFSNPDMVNMGKVWFWPVDVTLAGYREIFSFANLWQGYRNSLFYTVLGTGINLAVTLTAGYALSRKDLVGRSIIIIIFLIPMYFGGGLIPTYLQVNRLGLVNTIWAMVIPNAMSIFNVIIARTFFQTNIPQELYESSVLDGCSNFRFFLSIVLPLSSAIVAVLAIYYAAGHWNSYFQALIYLRNKSLSPLQIVLREILILNSTDNETFQLNFLINASKIEKYKLAQLIKYGTIIVSSVPLLILYPFLQKHFVKGVMLGSLKG